MGDPFDFDDDGRVSEEEEEEAFLLFMDDDDEDEAAVDSRGCGCLSMVLLIMGVTAAAVALPLLI